MGLGNETTAAILSAVSWPLLTNFIWDQRIIQLSWSTKRPWYIPIQFEKSQGRIFRVCRPIL